MCFVYSAKRVQSNAPFWNCYIHIEKVCVFNSFHNFQANPVKLSMHTSHEEEMSMTFFLWGQLQGFNKYAPFLKILITYPYIECFCLKLLPQFSSHSNETCCAWSLWTVDVHITLDKLTSYKSINFVFYFFSPLGDYISYDN